MQIEALMGKQIPMKKLPDNLVISDIFSEYERPDANMIKNYQKGPKLNMSKGAFHEKSEKNKQKNSGSPSKKNKIEYTKMGKIKYKLPKQKRYK